MLKQDNLFKKFIKIFSQISYSSSPALTLPPPRHITVLGPVPGLVHPPRLPLLLRNQAFTRHAKKKKKICLNMTFRNM